MNSSIVSVEQLCYRHPDGTEALRGVSFSIRQGEAVAIIGANGAGKSTLLLHLNGCLLPLSGSVRIGDHTVCRETLPQIRRTVGMTFQNSDDQLFMPTVSEDVAFGPNNMGFPPQEVDIRVEAALSAVDALHLRKRPPYRLSGGEKRRVAIATVIAMEPDIIVLDEPTTGLDSFGRRKLIHILKNIHHTRIIATHDLNLVLELCGRVILLHEGGIAADGPVDSILGDTELLERCRLEPPSFPGICPQCGKTQSRPQGNP
ncbi:MAG: ABC transporter ATP-binding protein [Desulfuromonadales bacterium]|nr:ABC transporter ATP-binding protein [Desulfuromonadales bacterium]